jgi:phage shock protein PspC (stress-responsive transcriptional regulator)
MTNTPPTQPPYKQLRRPTTDRIIAGVASGIGRYFDVDPTLVRVVFAVTALLTGGFAALAYPIMWFLMPEEPADAAPWPYRAGPAAPPAGYPAPPAGYPAPPAGPTAPPAGPTAPPAGPTAPPTARPAGPAAPPAA